jgi:phage-related protein
MLWKLLQYDDAFDQMYGSCDDDLREAIDQRVDFLRHHGNQTREPVSKPLGDGLFELRANTHQAQVRFVFFFADGRCIVIVSSFIKKGRKTPKHDLALAKVRRAQALKNLERWNVPTFLN